MSPAAAFENMNIRVVSVIAGVVALSGFVIAATIWANNLDHQIKALSLQMGDRYTLTMAAENALRTALENPGMRVPDPRNPGSVIVVKTSNGNGSSDKE